MRRNKASTSRGVQKNSVRVFLSKNKQERIYPFGLVHDHLTTHAQSPRTQFPAWNSSKIDDDEDRVGRGDQPVAMKFMLIKLVPAFNP